MIRIVQIFFIGSIILKGELKGQTKADALLAAQYEKSKAVGMMAGYMSDDEKWSSAIGYKDLDKKEALTVSTTIRIASIAKIMTTVAVMQLVETQKLDLEAPVSRYFENVSEYHKEITVRQLLNHSSGIRAYKSSKERENKIQYDDLQKAYEIIKEDPLEIDSGTGFFYTSYGYVLLGIIIEKVSGLSYESYLTENIWKPLGMENTGVEQSDKILESHSRLYHKSGNGKVKEVKRTNLSDRVPAGGLYSTIDDILLFGHGLLNEKLITQASLKSMMSSSGLKKEGNPYGLGLYLYGENPKFGNVIGHSGTQAGASAQLMLLPDEKVAIFVAANTSGVWRDVFSLNVSLFQKACE